MGDRAGAAGRPPPGRCSSARCWARRPTAGRARPAPIVADVLRAGAFLGIALVDPFVATFAFALIAGLGTALFKPAALSGLPSLVAPERSAAATSLYGAITDFGYTVGPALVAGGPALHGPRGRDADQRRDLRDLGGGAVAARLGRLGRAGGGRGAAVAAARDAPRPAGGPAHGGHPRRDRGLGGRDVHGRPVQRRRAAVRDARRSAAATRASRCSSPCSGSASSSARCAGRRGESCRCSSGATSRGRS